MANRVQLLAKTSGEHTLERVDAVASDLFPQYSRARLQGWIKSGELTIDGTKVKPSKRLNGGETLAIDAVLEALDIVPEDIPLDLVYEDESLFVLNKPAGLVVHPGAGNPNGTLLNGLLYADPNLATLPRAGIVHRLDKDTTGLMMVARSDEAYGKLVRQLSERAVSRGYEAIVHGAPPDEGVIDKPIGRHRTQRTKMAVVVNGKEAITRFSVIERFRGFTHVGVALETGRTHQIRVHMQHIGFPLVGDPVYGKKGGPEFPRQALHARTLTLEHPVTGKKLKLSEPLPDDMEALLDQLYDRGAP